MGSSFNTCIGGDMCIDVAGFVGQITVTGGCDDCPHIGCEWDR